MYIAQFSNVLNVYISLSIMHSLLWRIVIIIAFWILAHAKARIGIVNWFSLF